VKTKAKGSGELNGFLDVGSKIQGELRFEDTFRIDGHLQGKTTSKGDLIVGEKGRVEGEIAVGQLFVSGTVLGSVQATGRVEIMAGARVEADVDTPVLVVEEGAHFTGGCTMGRRAKESQPEETSTSTVAPAATLGR
jgi:cytoskeletal protein CcmA (bactofilin family)